MQLLQLILESDEAGYVYEVCEEDCLRHRVPVVDSVLSIKKLPVIMEEENDEDSEVDPGIPFSIDDLESSKLVYEGHLQSDPSVEVSTSRNISLGTNSSDRRDPSNADAIVRPPIVNDVTESVNVRFVDESPGALVDYTIAPDEDQYADIQPSTDLSEFLSRPVLINTTNIDLTTTIGAMTPFSPWYLYFNAPNIKNKLQNYSYITCKLHIKTVVNCSPFYYGSILYAYQPASGWTITPNVSDNTSIITASQLPHYWIYPQTSHGGEMVLPFFYHKTYLDITTATETQNMGQIIPWVVTNLQAANGQATGNVNLNTYAWATDVKLHAPTYRGAMQGLTTNDEYGTGFISKPASAIATALGYLSEVPVIGKYATASSMATSTIGKIAHLFGYTNLPNMNNVNYLKPHAAPHFASSDVSVPFEKWSLDPKTEMSIDPTLHGLPSTDELDISYLIQKEAFLCTFEWTQSQAVDTLQFAACVTPDLFNYTSAGGTGKTAYYDTPLRYFTRLFQFWKGDIIFRFKFICSPYHKGRVRFSFDPRGNITTVSPDYVSIFNEIIDIGTVQDIEIRVPYMQNEPWLDTAPYNITSLNWATPMTGTPLSSIQYVSGYNNGTITCRVVNQLTAPATTSDITVQVFVRAADSLEVGVPINPLQISPMICQSTITDNIGGYENPLLVTAGRITTTPPKTRYLLNFGENIKSFRKLLRRTVYHSSSSYNDTGNNAGTVKVISVVHNRIPFLPGFDSNGVSNVTKPNAGGTGYCNLACASVFTYLYPCFAASRGSFNWHHIWDSVSPNRSLESGFLVTPPSLRNLAYARYPYVIAPGTTVQNPSTYNITGGVNGSNHQAWSYYQNQSNMSAARTSAAGGSIQVPSVNKTLSFVAPNYNQYKFNFNILNNGNGSANAVGSALDTGTYRDNVVSSGEVLGNASGVSILTTVDKYFSVGADFNFLYFLNVPVWYTYANADLKPA